jgi:hypothetical protein
MVGDEVSRSAAREPGPTDVEALPDHRSTCGAIAGAVADATQDRANHLLTHFGAP